jgi:hypothetical protein
MNKHSFLKSIKKPVEAHERSKATNVRKKRRTFILIPSLPSRRIYQPPEHEKKKKTQHKTQPILLKTPAREKRKRNTLVEI